MAALTRSAVARSMRYSDFGSECQVPRHHPRPPAGIDAAFVDTVPRGTLANENVNWDTAVKVSAAATASSCQTRTYTSGDNHGRLVHSSAPRSIPSSSRTSRAV
eukprot:Polyplicarium_translucidae@DN5428_c0_g1_i1.p1